MNIPIAKINFGSQEFENVKNVMQSGWVVQGKYVQELEGQWRVFTGAKHAFAVTSCTTALHLSLYATGINPGDEVIVSSFTWIATANSIETLFAKPVFCDISPDHFNIDVSRVERLITDKTKAIVPVHLFGYPADMDPMMNLANKYKLHVIEDAACGFGAYYKGKHVGNFGDAGCFSMHPRKAITSGEGGIITTNDDNLAAKIKALRDHGAMMSDLQRHEGNKPYLLPDFPYAGFNYRITDLQAAIAVPQMSRAKQILERRIEIARDYDKFLKDIPWLKPVVFPGHIGHGYQSYVCIFEPEEISAGNYQKIGEQRNAFMDYLYGHGIATRPGTHAVHALTYYREKYHIPAEKYIHALIADKCSIALPLFPSITNDELEYIKQHIKQYEI